jgi:hypothetical protein
MLPQLSTQTTLLYEGASTRPLRSDGGRGGSLDDDLRALERPEQRREGLAVGERDDVVDQPADDLERPLPDLRDLQAVDRAVDLSSLTRCPRRSTTPTPPRE